MCVLEVFTQQAQWPPTVPLIFFLVSHRPAAVMFDVRVPLIFFLVPCLLLGCFLLLLFSHWFILFWCFSFCVLLVPPAKSKRQVAAPQSETTAAPQTSEASTSAAATTVATATSGKRTSKPVTVKAVEVAAEEADMSLRQMVSFCGNLLEWTLTAQRIQHNFHVNHQLQKIGVSFRCSWINLNWLTVAIHFKKSFLLKSFSDLLSQPLIIRLRYV